MASDEEIARKAAQISTTGRNIPLIQIPAYVEWSARKLKEGESAAFIANLDAISTWMTPDEQFSDADFDDMLEDVKEAVRQMGGEAD